MNKTNIINLLIQKINAKTYLEIGLGTGENFKNIKCEKKVNVDTNSEYNPMFCMTSDEFFAHNKEKFDVVFIDGLHYHEQVTKDVLNSLEILNTNGFIICHDTNPEKEEYQIVPYTAGTWTGDCWKSIVNFRNTRTDLEIYTVECDYGCTVISNGSQNLLKITEEVNFKNFEKNKKTWLNLISEVEFLNQINITFNDDKLKILLNKYILDSDNAENNYNLALYYINIDQTASAISYFLRTAERSDDIELKYECLLQSANCFNKQGSRSFTVKCLIQHAISLLPTRPEAYYLLGVFYSDIPHEKNEGKWFDSYMIASLALNVVDFNSNSLKTNLNFPGKYAILFQKAIAGWWCGLCDESVNLLKDLLMNYNINDTYRSIIIKNLKNFNVLNTETIEYYDSNKFNKLKIHFNNANLIEKNFSESYQDMFVLTMLNGKTNGTYLEIGAGDPFYGNNTALLETKFNWKGISVDLNDKFVEQFLQNRKNSCILKDARLIDYDKFLSGLNFNQTIDYLQLDCDPPEVTFNILLNIPFEKYKFAVITYEHDYYCDETKSFRDRSRDYLKKYGYVLVAGNIAPDNWRTYEDWWVHPDLINKHILNQMLTDDNIKKAQDYILKK